ncbi:uncharacterized protein [Apostichopus japonicus]|uniref:uncharacterized protein isoform X2 n=1 Tax=Stichopus japonicus TaxID=307972 RepID=UPI003AB17BD7
MAGIEDGERTQCDWREFYSERKDDHLGFVLNRAKFEDLKCAFEVGTKTHFVAVKTSVNFGHTEVNPQHHRLQWGDEMFTGHPYIVLKAVRYECHHGPDRNAAKKEKAKNKVDASDHNYKKKRMRLQPMKKINCPATIVAKEVILFPDFEITGLSKWKREQISKEIKTSLGVEECTINCRRRIFVKLPADSEHSFHTQDIIEELSMPIDPRITCKVQEYVMEGFQSSALIKSLLETYVRKELFAEEKCPSWNNRRFFPTQRDISNMIYSTRLKSLKSKYDQENLLGSIEEWRQESPEHRFHFAPVLEDKIADEASSAQRSGSLLVFQSQWQRHLLSRYGGELCLLDAMYRTTKYAVPLFFICVKTNTDYAVVAVFASQFEDSNTIVTALNIIREWNPGWSPSYFMVDNCEAEINALENTFPDCKVILCDFHREQAWIRWLRASKHGLLGASDDILLLLQRIAQATTQESYDAALAKLHVSSYWRDNKTFREWIHNTWLKNAQKWAWIYRQDRFNMKINTNNGIERQNRTLKYEFLSRFTDRTLTGMLTTVIKKFLPEMHRRYIECNLKATSVYRSYNASIPRFLQNRPKEFILHCVKRLSSAEDCRIQRAGNSFKVCSFSEHNKEYEVTLGNDESIPSCQCYDWLHTHWPCKHLLAVVLHHPSCSWNDLPEHYRENPLFTLDEVCFGGSNLKMEGDNPNEGMEVGSSNSPEPPQSEIGEENVKSEPSRSSLASAIREEVDKIRSISYLDVPVDILSNAKQELVRISNMLYRSVPSSNELPVLNPDATVKSLGKIPFGISKLTRGKDMLKQAKCSRTFLSERRKNKRMANKHSRERCEKKGTTSSHVMPKIPSAKVFG